MNKYLAGSLAIVWTGLRACLIALAYDAFLSVYSGRLGFYAPFLYPICFFLGAVIELQSIRKRKRSGAGHPPSSDAPSGSSGT